MTNNGSECSEQFPPRPVDLDSNDPEVLRAALIREATARARAECVAKMQADVVKHALDLLVREPDIDGFFGALTKTMVEEAESDTCGVWLIDESGERCELWMAYVKDRLWSPRLPDWHTHLAEKPVDQQYPCEAVAEHLFS